MQTSAWISKAELLHEVCVVVAAEISHLGMEKKRLSPVFSKFGFLLQCLSVFHLLYYACQTVVGTCRITCAWRKLPNFGSRKVSWRLFTSSHFAFLESLVTLKLQWSQSCQAVFRNTGERFGSPADSGEPALVCSLALHSCPPKVAVFGLIFLSEGLRTLCRASGWDRAQARNCEAAVLQVQRFASLRLWGNLPTSRTLNLLQHFLRLAISQQTCCGQFVFACRSLRC